MFDIGSPGDELISPTPTDEMIINDVEPIENYAQPKKDISYEQFPSGSNSRANSKSPEIHLSSYHPVINQEDRKLPKSHSTSVLPSISPRRASPKRKFARTLKPHEMSDDAVPFTFDSGWHFINLNFPAPK